MNNGLLVTLPWQQFGPLRNGSCRSIDPHSLQQSCHTQRQSRGWKQQHQQRLAMTPAPRDSECYAKEAADFDDGGNEVRRHSAALAWLDDDAAQPAEAGAEVEPAVGGKDVEQSLGGT